VRVRHIGKSLFKNLRKSEECLDTASESLRTGRWNTAVINAVHCGISACDALTVFMLGVRHAGERHEDARSLFQTVSRWAAFKMAWKDAARIYVIVVILLALGALWEMTILFLFLRPT